MPFPSFPPRHGKGWGDGGTGDGVEVCNDSQRITQQQLEATGASRGLHASGVLPWPGPGRARATPPFPKKGGHGLGQNDTPKKDGGRGTQEVFPQPPDHVNQPISKGQTQAVVPRTGRPPTLHATRGGWACKKERKEPMVWARAISRVPRAFPRKARQPPTQRPTGSTNQAPDCVHAPKNKHLVYP